MTMSPAEARSATVAIPESGQEAVMNAASGSRVTGGMLFLLAGLAALGALAELALPPSCRAPSRVTCSMASRLAGLWR
jgi:hypothetical protein